MRRFKSQIALLFLPIIVAGSLDFPLVYLEFEMNKDYIVNELCINRDKPITTCGGSCYIQKRLDTENSEATSTSSSNRRIGMALFFQTIGKVFIPLNTTHMPSDYWKKEYEFTYSKTIFHPPTRFTA